MSLRAAWVVLLAVMVHGGAARAGGPFPFPSRIVAAPGGRFYVVAANDSHDFCPVGFWLCEIARGSEPVRTEIDNHLKPRPEPYRPRKGDRVLCSGTFEQIPGRIEVSAAGLGFAALEKYGDLPSHGTEWAALMYGPGGEIVRRLRLGDLYTAGELGSFLHQWGKTHWLLDAWIDDVGKELVVVDVHEELRAIPFDPGGDLRKAGAAEVLRALSIPSRDTNARALELMLRYPVEAPSERLAELAAGPDPGLSVRALVARAAGGNEAARKDLLGLLTGPRALGGQEANDTYHFSRPGKEKALEEIRAASYAIEKLPLLFGEEAGPVVRSLVFIHTADSAARAFASLGKAALPILGEMLADASASQRLVAAVALGEIGDRRAVPWLLKATKDSHAPVSHKAGRSLLKLCGPDLASELISLLQADSPDADAILGYFSRHRHPRVVPVLIDFLARAPDKAAVRAALKKQTGKDFGEDAEAWRKGTEEE